MQNSICVHLKSIGIEMEFHNNKLNFEQKDIIDTQGKPIGYYWKLNEYAHNTFRGTS